jgi:hypothetical protein
VSLQIGHSPAVDFSRPASVGRAAQAGFNATPGHRFDWLPHPPDPIAMAM